MEEAIREIMRRGFGTIDMTQSHGLPDRQLKLSDSIPAEDPIVNGIVRDGVVLQIVYCSNCGEVISAAPDEVNPLCGWCE